MGQLEQSTAVQCSKCLQVDKESYQFLGFFFFPLVLSHVHSYYFPGYIKTVGNIY